MSHRNGLILEKKKSSALRDDILLGLRRGEFHLLYQPQFSSAGHAILAVEALARWSHPLLGQVGPVDFVAAAEREGVIGQLGVFVLRQACRDARSWPGTKVSVNISRLQLREDDFVESVKSIAAEQDFPLERLDLEITESAAAEDFDLVRTSIEALRGVGVRFALDDYGTGKAGPEDLRRLPLDIVKIDQRVVAEIGTDRSAVVIREAIAIARELGLKTTAEGVETKAQEAFLRECGCDTLQGYLYSRPVVARAIAELLNQAQT